MRKRSAEVDEPGDEEDGDEEGERDPTYDDGEAAGELL
jgi:hypothetical protein